MDQQNKDVRIDFLQCLDEDTSVHILSFFDEPADIVRASAVSRIWRRLVIGNGLAKQLCLKRFPELSNIVSIVEASEETSNLTMMKTINALEWDSLERDHKVYASLLEAITKSKVLPKDCIVNAVSASSTDRYPDESVVNTLNPRDRFVRRASYWSSKGQSNPDVPETLIYKIRNGIWVVTEVDIQPFEAFFQTGNPIYSAKSVRFRMGHPKSREEIDHTLRDLPLEKPHVDDVFVWTYTSPEFPMMQENRLQPFKLPEPVLCIDSYLQIELLGRVQTQDADGLFYICINYTRVMGRALFPAFDIEILEEPQGKLLLKYSSENINSILWSNPHDYNTFHLRFLEEEMLQERIGVLDNLLRGIQQQPEYEDDENGEDDDGNEDED